MLEPNDDIPQNPSLQDAASDDLQASGEVSEVDDKEPTAVAKSWLRKLLWGGLTFAATLSVGFLGFVGMYTLVQSLVLCGLSFVLAAAFESQVYGTGIRGGLERIFDKFYLANGVIERFLNELMAKNEQTYTNNPFYEAYKALNKDIKKLKDYIDNQEKVKDSQLYHGKEWKETEARIEAAQRRLKQKQQYLIYKRSRLMERLYAPLVAGASDKRTAEDKEIDELLVNHAAELREEIAKKLRWIRWYAWPLLVGFGLCAGFATLGAMQGGLLMCAESGIPILVGLSATPFGIVVALSVIAAVGYTVLTYQGVCAMIQEYQKHGKGYFERRTDNGETKGETSAQYYIRCAVTVFAIGLSIAATIATAGTWWNLVRDGSVALHFIEQVTLACQVIMIGAMVIPNVAFNVQNSVKTAEEIVKSDYKALFKKAWSDVKESFNDEFNNRFNKRAYHSVAPPLRLLNHGRDLIRFLNPIRIMEKVFSLIFQSFGLFMGHIASIGVSSASDGAFPGVIGLIVSPIVAALNELLTDLNYMPDDLSNNKESHEHGGEHSHDHNHENFFLKALFFPFKLVGGMLKVMSACWDCVFSPKEERNFEQSLKKMFTIPIPVPKKVKEQPITEKNSEDNIQMNALKIVNNPTAVRMHAVKEKPVIQDGQTSPRRRLSFLEASTASNQHSMWYRKPNIDNSDPVKVKQAKQERAPREEPLETVMRNNNNRAFVNN